MWVFSMQSEPSQRCRCVAGLEFVAWVARGTTAETRLKAALRIEAAESAAQSAESHAKAEGAKNIALKQQLSRTAHSATRSG